MASHLIVVGADKGGVGKTTVSRAVLDYCDSKRIAARAFDTETPHGVLKRFHPVSTSVVDLTRSDGQMEVFDTLAKAPVTLIDIRAGLLSPTLQTLTDIGLLDAVTKGEIRLTLLHVIGSSIASFDEIARTSVVLAGAKHILVRNRLNDSPFFSWDASNKALDQANMIDIPKLNELAAESVDKAGLSFQHFIENDVYSMVLRGYTRHWAKGVNAEFDDKLQL